MYNIHEDNAFKTWLLNELDNHAHARQFNKLIDYIKEQEKCLEQEALSKGDTEYVKGQAAGLKWLLDQIDFLITTDTDTETGLMPDTETGTVKE